MRYIFFGSSEFAKIVLEKLLKNGWKPILVVTAPPKPKGRKKILSPAPVYELSLANNLKTAIPENLKDEKFINLLKSPTPDFAILTAYGKIIPVEVLKIPRKGFLNLHPSLLPRWRGATPIQSAILTDEETGVTLFVMDEKIDHGPTIKNKKLNIKNKKYTYPELLKELAILGTKVIIESAPQWLEGKITPLPQDEFLATYCHKITSEDEKINWNKSAIEIDRKTRALNPQPGVYTLINDRILKIISGFPSNDNIRSLAKATGEVFEIDKKMAVKCRDGFYLIEEIKPAGKNIMSGENFLRGNQQIIGKILN